MPARPPLPVASCHRRCCAACWASCWRISRSIAPTAATACSRPPIAPCSTAPPAARAAPASRPTVGRSIRCCAASPSPAKAVEDTGFYRYGRLLSRNDVGFDAATFALDADAFHRRMQRRRADWPRALLATATHDHKRGEDVRARLAVLSGMAAEWAALQRDWVEASRPLARPISDGKWAPGPGDVALLLQTIVGA